MAGTGSRSTSCTSPGLHFQLTAPTGGSKHIWTVPFPTGQWNDWVIGFRQSRGNDGWVELYRNRVQQTFNRAEALCGRATAWLNSAKLGTSYADVAP